MPTIRLNDINLYYEVQGKGTTILFLPGLGHCSKLWRPQVGYFQKEYRVITCDLRGTGLSEPGKNPYSMELYAADIKGLFESLNIDQAIVCGLSLGSLVAQQFVHDYPKMCRGLILCGAHSHPGIMQRIIGGLVPGALKKFFKKKTVKEFAIATAKSVFKGPDQDQIREFHANEVISTTVDGYLNSWRAVSLFDSLRYLRDIYVPTLIYHGENDDAFIAKQALVFLKYIRHSTRKVMPGAGHILNLEKPDVFNETVLKFIKEEVLDAAP